MHIISAPNHSRLHSVAASFFCGENYALVSQHRKCMRFSTLSCVDRLQLDLQILTVSPGDPSFFVTLVTWVVTTMAIQPCASAGTPEGTLS